MPKPVVSKINPFDANYDKIISISWNGDQSYQNRLILYDAETLQVVYDNTITTFSLNHTIPANTLPNGKKWIAQCQVFNVDSVASPLSDKLFFFTFEKPTFEFENIIDGQKIKNASIDASIKYTQLNYEEIQSYKFYLYDSTKTLILESNTIYDRYNIHYIYRGFENDTQYYIRCKGLTVNGFEVDTGYISIYVNYKTPSSYGIIYAHNVPAKGYIKYNTNIITIQYKGNNVFDFENGMIDLTNSSIEYESGFCIEKDFTLLIRGMKLNHTATIFEAKNNRYGFKIDSIVYNLGEIRFKLTVPNAIENYILYSEPLSFSEEDMICVWVRRINNVYQMEIFIDYNFEAMGNYWYGNQQEPPSEIYDIWINKEGPLSFADKNVVKEYYEETESEDIELNDLWLGGE